MLEISCSGNGKLSMGKMNPERSMVGIMSDTKLANMAACCVSTLVEMRIPSDNEATVQTKQAKTNKATDPTMGSPKTNIPNRMIRKLFSRESIK